MSRYALLEPLAPPAPPPLRAGRAPFGFREVWLSGFAMRDEQMRRAVIRRAIAEAQDHLLRDTDAFRYVLPGPDGIPVLSRPRIRFRRVTPMPGEAPAFAVTVVAYPKGALP